MTARGDKNPRTGGTKTGYSELFLVIAESGRIDITNSEPADQHECLARFFATGGQVQVYVESTAVPLVRNGTILSDPVVLKNGDRLRAGDLVLNFASSGRGGILYRQDTDDNSTLPPVDDKAREAQAWLLEASPGEKQTGNELLISTPDDGGREIAPGEYLKSQDKDTGDKRIPIVPLAIGGVFIALALVAGFIFSATPVQIVVDPEPDEIAVDGAWLSFELGGRFLLLPGAARVNIQKSGYYPIQETIQISSSSSKEVSFHLRLLPDIFEINSEPDANASVQIDGEPVGQTPLMELAIEPGEHQMLVRAKRFLDHQQNISVDGGGKRETITVRLEPAWADVEVTSKPADARVYVDDREVGRTPLRTELLQGARKLKVSKTGFKSWQENIRIVAGEPRRLPVTLAKADGKAVIRTDPPGASVTIDSQYRGRTPLNIALAPDRTYRLSFSLAGFEKATRNISIRSDQDASVLLNLRALLGIVDLRSEPAGASLTIDGVKRGQTNLKLELPAKAHLIEFSKSGYAPYHARVTPRPGFAQQIVARLKTLEQARWEAIPATIKTSVGEDMKLVRGGTFDMGAPRRQAGRRANEIQHPVKLTRAYYLATHEVTNAEYRQFKPDHDSGQIKSTSLNPDSHPVVQVSWHDAASFCNWLSAKDGLPAAYTEKDGKMIAVTPLNTGYRLPSEAEWAFAYRVLPDGVLQLYPWGDTLPPKNGAGNFADLSARSVLSAVIEKYDDKFLATAPVGEFAANKTGFFDLAGNVAEWMHDYYSTDPLSVGQLSVDPLGSANGEYHVVRGSSWTSGSIGELRVSFRDYSAGPRNDLGFRLARYVE